MPSSCFQQEVWAPGGWRESEEGWLWAEAACESAPPPPLCSQCLWAGGFLHFLRLDLPFQRGNNNACLTHAAIGWVRRGGGGTL